MKKIILISFLIVVNLYSSTKYYLDYKDDNIIKTTELTKEKYLKTKYNLDFYKNTTKRVKWTYNQGKDYDILKVYKIEQEQEKTVKKEVKKEPREIVEKEKKQEITREIKTNKIEKEQSYFLHILLSILIIYFIRKLISRNKNKVDENELFQDLENTKIEEKTENLNYIDLEKERLKIYNDLKYNKEIEKEEKKKLYKKISKLKTNIKNKDDLEKLNNDLKDIIKEV